jgi:hypothetical protein
MYFPAWNLGKCATVGAKCNRSEDAIKTRYEKFGGILRHILAEDAAQAESDLYDSLSRRQVTARLERKNRSPGW